MIASSNHPTTKYTRAVQLASALYVIAVGLGIYLEFYYITLLPVILVGIWAALYKIEYLLYFIVLCTPFSLNLEMMDLGGAGMYLPTEPLLFGILVLFIFKALSGRSIDAHIFKHPIAYFIYAYLIWMFLTSITSEYPLVSFKFLINRLWFLVPIFFVCTHLFIQLKRLKIFILCYFFPLLGAIIYTIIRHAQFGFDKKSAHWVMEPFFKDHTSYGAVLAMFLPVIIGLIIQKKMNLLLRIVLILGFIILATGLVLSYTRAAWLSVLGAMVVFGFLMLRVRLKTMLFTFVLGAGILYSGWENLSVALQKNKQESSDKLDEHVSSMANVSSDASNLERLNRWSCAWQMFKERPIVGWGPGTYQFVYAPFQTSSQRTVISTNQGDAGNAHSEYLGPLCEQGLLGLILFIALIIGISNTSFRLFYELKDFTLRMYVCSLYLGIVTYVIHGTLNNFLDTDKAAIPFWGFTAGIVAIDLYHRKRSTAAEPA